MDYRHSVTVFACAGCAATLTVPVSRVALPEHAGEPHGHGPLGVLMGSGTFAVNPEPFGPPWRPGVEDDPHAPRGTVVVAPGDVRGTVVIPDRCGGSCCGMDGGDGPNLACERCGQAVATHVDDCGLWQAIWLDPRAVKQVTSSALSRAAARVAGLAVSFGVSRSGDRSPG